jgi:nifR3 family TIM-barrel protein
LGIQLFGADPARLAEAVKAVIDWVSPDFIDLNFGCPVNKVVARNGGSALLKDCPLLASVAREVVAAASNLPVTAKIRIGWDSRSVNALETARILEGEGISRLAVHGRTKEQGYTGEADWQVIGAVANAVKIPVIGNGDIDSASVALQRLKETNVAGLMIGRAAMCHPWIFREIRSAIAGGGAPEAVTLRMKWDFIIDHTRREIEWWSGKEELAIRSMRARFMSYTKGLPGGARLRERLQQVTSAESLEAIAEGHLLEYGDQPV